MTDERSNEGIVKIEERDVLTFYTDGPVGAAQANGLQRLLLGESIFDPEPGAQLPRIRPVLNLVMTSDTARLFGEYLLSLPGVQQPSE